MSYDAWPSPEARRGSLPRIEDLPVAEQGYEQEAVRRAFDDFYRHAAQLDASLKALEAVEGFQRAAAELRNDLRTLHALDVGVSGSAWSGAPYAGEKVRPRAELPTAALRIAGEAAVIVAVGVIAGVTHLRTWVIISLMAAALVVVWLSEWLAARARTRVPASIYDPLYQAVSSEEVDAPEPGASTPYAEAPALEAGVGWSAIEHLSDEDEPGGSEVDEHELDEAPPEELTMVEEPPEDTEEHAAPLPNDAEIVDEQQEAPAGDEASPEQPRVPEPEPEPKSKRGWFRRRRRQQESEPESLDEPEATSAPEASGHVHVLASGEVHEEPWERGFDGE